jgi:hypothetical protein
MRCRKKLSDALSVRSYREVIDDPQVADTQILSGVRGCRGETVSSVPVPDLGQPAADLHDPRRP